MILICGRSRSTPPALISPMAITAGALGGARLPHRKKDEDSSSARRQPGFLMQSQCGEHLWAVNRETISFGVVAETNSPSTVCFGARTDVPHGCRDRRQLLGFVKVHPMFMRMLLFDT